MFLYAFALIELKGDEMWSRLAGAPKRDARCDLTQLNEDAPEEDPTSPALQIPRDRLEADRLHVPSGTMAAARSSDFGKALSSTAFATLICQRHLMAFLLDNLLG